jgi:hypothetical protein
MTYAYPLEIKGRHLFLKIAAPAKQCSSHHWKVSKVQTDPPFAHGFQPSVCIKLCRQQAEVIQNHENEHVRGIGQGEARHRKYCIRGLNLAAVKLPTVQATEVPL